MHAPIWTRRAPLLHVLVKVHHTGLASFAWITYTDHLVTSGRDCLKSPSPKCLKELTSHISSLEEWKETTNPISCFSKGWDESRAVIVQCDATSERILHSAIFGQPEIVKRALAHHRSALLH